MTETPEEITERIAKLKEEGKVTEEAGALLDELVLRLGELERSNRALRKTALKAAGGQAMSSRLRDALQE